MPHTQPGTAERRWTRFLARLNANEHKSLLVRRPDVRDVGVAAQLDESMRWSA